MGDEIRGKAAMDSSSDGDAGSESESSDNSDDSHSSSEEDMIIIAEGSKYLKPSGKSFQFPINTQFPKLELYNVSNSYCEMIQSNFYYSPCTLFVWLHSLVAQVPGM